MEVFKKFVSLLLVLSLSPLSVLGNVPLEEIDDDTNPFENSSTVTSTGGACTQMDAVPAPEGVCCEGLELNPNNGKCDEPVNHDPALVTCAANPECGGTTSCLPQTAQDQYSGTSPSSSDPDELAENRSYIEMLIGDVENFKPVGASCSHAKECVSYDCVGSVCIDKKVCRYGDEGEFVALGKECGTGLLRSTSGKCELDPAASNPVFLGLLNDVKIETAGQCQFKLDEETRQKSIIAMKSLRAMEWMLASTSLTMEDDCFQTIPLLKDQIATPYLETRKGILGHFSEGINQIETDFKHLIDAKKIGDNTITIHGDEQISGNDLATRQTSGYDSLMMMYRRNLLFQSYESLMLETVKNANTKVSGLSKGMATWKDEDSSWNIGETTVANYNCGAKYKKWKPIKWRTKYHSNTANRWIRYYEVTGSSAGNADIVKRDKVALNLSLMSGLSKEAVISEFTKDKYYLIDPMMEGGQSFNSFGTPKNLGASGFLGLGKKDLRKPRYLKGTGNGNYTAIYNALKPKVKEFYKNLKTTPGQVGFVYEPELLTTTAKDCLEPQLFDHPSVSAEEKAKRQSACAQFDGFLEEVLDEGFAQFLAYSKYNKSTYSGYFRDANTWRRRLLAKLEVDMINISKYYETVISYREQQNECIEKVINGIADSGVLTTGDGGLVEGTYTDSSSNLDPTNYSPGSQIGLDSSSSALNTRKVSKLTRGKYSFDLEGMGLKKLGDKSRMDSVVKNATVSSSAGVSGSGSALLAARKDSMKKSNEKAKNLGLNIADKQKAVKETIDSLAGSKGSSMAASNSSASGSSSSGARSGYSSKGASFNNSQTGSAAVSEGTGTSSQDIANIKVDEAGVGAGNGTGATGTNGQDFISGVAAGSASGAGDGANGQAGGDGTGLSDSDKERMLTGYEKNKNAYESYEDDGLFSKVSKAYVRNLGKVLTRKKKID